MANPYVAGSHPYVDYGIWQKGAARGAGELDFLRELHSPATLQTIKAAITAKTRPSIVTRVSSIWLDKYPLCQPTLRSGATRARRELGDLAIILRSTVHGSLQMRMWIMQAKLYSPNWQSKGSSKKEIELYEQCPEFDLFSSQHAQAQMLGTFDLKGPGGFGHPPYIGAIPFWSYLHIAHKGFVPAGGLSHICHEWPSSLQPRHSESYVDGLVNMSLQLGGGGYSAGADVHKGTPYAEWRRLYLTLWRYAGTKKTTRLPGRAWRISTMMMMNPTWMSPISFGRFAFEHDDGSFEVASTGFDSPRQIDPGSVLAANIRRFGDTLLDDELEDLLVAPDHIDPPPDEVQTDGPDGGFTFLVIDQVSSGVTELPPNEAA